MYVSQQLVHLLKSLPASLAAKTSKEWYWLVLYLAVGLAVFSIAATLLSHYQENLKQLVLDYLFPTEWHALSDTMFGYLYDTQSKAVIANMVISGSLVLASIVLFPLKELYSASVEKALGSPIGPSNPLTLTMQAIEEIRLVLFYLAAQMIIVWIGYYPFSWTTILSTVLSYFFLFYTFTLDLISPTWQRHGVSYSKINKTLFALLPITLLFGVLYTLPAILIGEYLLSNSDLGLLNIAFVLFIVNLVFIALAIPSGTYLVCQLKAYEARLANVTKTSKHLGYLLALFILICFSVLHGRLLQSIHHKSQLLKAEYDLSWSSFDLDFSAIFTEDKKITDTSLKFELTIHNPTEFDLIVEDSFLLLSHNQKVVSRVDIDGFSVAAGDSKTIPMSINANANWQSLKNLDSWQDAFANWEAKWYLKLFPSIPFIIKLTE